MQTKTWITLFAGGLLLTACKKQAEPVTPQPSATERIILDTSYGNDIRQKMDVYLPANRDVTTKAIVIIHGGGWAEGSKNDITNIIPNIRQLLPGYAVINIGYRLAAAGNNLFPTQENDVKAAVQFIISNSKNFNISNKPVMCGFSAGAHLALLHAFKNDPQNNVAAVVDFFGPTNLETLWNEGPTQQLILAAVTGKIYPDGKLLYQSSSPVNFVTSQSPPTLVLQGGKDDIVPVSQSNEIIQLLKAKSVVSELVLYPDQGHGWDGADLEDSMRKVVAFLNKHAR